MKLSAFIAKQDAQLVKKRKNLYEQKIFCRKVILIGRRNMLCELWQSNSMNQKNRSNGMVTDHVQFFISSGEIVLKP